MMKEINKEPRLKRTIISIILIVVFLYIFFIFYQYGQLNRMHRNQIRIFQRVIGVVAKDYPDLETEIIQEILNKGDIGNETLGADILNKYGYNLEMDLNRDIDFKEYRNNMVKFNLINLSILISINIAILYIVFNGYMKSFQKITDTMNNFIKGNYEFEDYKLKEGLISKVQTQLNTLGNSIALKEEKLIQDKEDTKSLVTDISHQLKTPLSSLEMSNSILIDEELTDEERKEFLEMSKIGIMKLDNLVDSLVSISRLEAAMIKLKPVKHNIKDTIKKSVNSVYIKALEKNIEIVADEFRDYFIEHDPKWTEEAIFNILENAVKYSNKDTIVKINIEETINFVRISIKDNGIGINSENYNNIFKRFYRGKHKDVEGSGVGLYLSRRIIEDQGGSITVKSEIGKGSTFRVLLPKSE